MKKTKIICTLGPRTDDEELMRSLVQNGMDIARFNFSHGTHEEQKARMDMLKRLRDEEGKPIAILLDTKGPEIHVQRAGGGCSDRQYDTDRRWIDRPAGESEER